MKRSGWTWLQMRIVVCEGLTDLCPPGTRYNCDKEKQCRDVIAPNASKSYYKRCRKLTIEVRRAK